MEVPGEGGGKSVSSVHELITTVKGDGVWGQFGAIVGLRCRGSRGGIGALGLLGAAGSASLRQAQGRLLRLAQDGVFGDAGMWFDRLTMNGWGRGTEGDGLGLGAAWDVFTRLGQCVQFRGQCVQFLARCVHFPAECVHFGGRGVQFSTVRPGWGWGTEGRRDSPFDKLRAGPSGGAGMTGMCPPCQANVSSFWPDVFTFEGNVSSFWPNVSTLAGQG